MINDEYMDYFHAIGAKFRPTPDNLKLLLIAGAALFSTVILTALLLGFYWNGDWHVKTPAGENLPHSESHTTDPAQPHKEVPSAEKSVEH